jgi:hypothetical protein
VRHGPAARVNISAPKWVADMPVLVVRASTQQKYKLGSEELIRKLGNSARANSERSAGMRPPDARLAKAWVE